MVVERKNINIMEAARAMLHDHDIPMHLWAEVARMVVYVQNHTPHRVLENKTAIRGNLGSKMGLIRKHANNIFCEFEFKNQ